MSAKKQSYTPGPWAIIGDDSFGGVPFIEIAAGECPSPTFRQICDVRSELDEDTDEFVIDDEARANARFISLAPEMAEALDEAATWFEQYAAEHYAKAKTAPDGGEQHGREVRGKTNADRAKKIRALLAKINGDA